MKLQFFLLRGGGGRYHKDSEETEVGQSLVTEHKGVGTIENWLPIREDVKYYRALRGIRWIFVAIQPKSYDRFFPHPPPLPLQMVNNDLLWKLQSCQAGGTFFFFSSLAPLSLPPTY